MAKTPKSEASELPNFESALAELEKIVSALEKGDLNLETALKQFERGISLTRQCQAALKQAELKVEKLMEKNGQATLEPFEPEDE